MVERKVDVEESPFPSPFPSRPGPKTAAAGKNLLPREYGTIEGDAESTQSSTVSSKIKGSLTRSPASSQTSTEPAESPLLLPKQPKSVLHPSALITLLKSSRLLMAVLGALMQSFMLTELEATLPWYIKKTFSYNSAQVGLIFLITSIPSFSAPLIGFLSDQKLGAKLMVTLGYLLLCPLWIALQLVNHKSDAQIALLCVLLFAIGFALNMILTPVYTEAKEAVDEAKRKKPGVFGEKGAYAQAFGLMNMAYAAGSIAGPLVGGLLVDRFGWGGSTITTGLLFIICAVPSFWITGGKKVKGKRLESGVEV